MIISYGIHSSDDGELELQPTTIKDIREYIYPYMTNDKVKGLYSAGFWYDCNWHVGLF